MFTQFRQAKIQDLCLTSRCDQDVLGLDVPMHHSGVVCGFKRVGDLYADLQDFVILRIACSNDFSQGSRKLTPSGVRNTSFVKAHKRRKSARPFEIITFRKFFRAVATNTTTMSSDE